MNFILQTIGGKVTLDMCFQMERAKEYWDWKNPDDTFKIEYGRLDNFWFNELNDLVKLGKFNPEEWCPVGTVEFVEKYIRLFFGNEKADNAMKPLNVPDCFLEDCRFECGRYIYNRDLSKGNVDEDFSFEETFFIKDNDRIKNPNNGIMTLQEAYDKGMRNVQLSTLIKNNSSEWRVFIHNGKAVDVRHYSGSPFEFPDMDIILDCYVPKLNLMEGTLDVFVDNFNYDTYVDTFVLECHKFFSCGLYGFDNNDILPLMYWRTYKELIK